MSGFDEFENLSETRSPSPLDLAAWTKQLGPQSTGAPVNLHLPGFSLLRGGDYFEGSRAVGPTVAELKAYQDNKLRLLAPEASDRLIETAISGLLSVLSHRRAIVQRLMGAKPIRVVLVPPKQGFGKFGFPRHISDGALGLFYNHPQQDEAWLGLRQEEVARRPWLMVHEMTHAVHLLGMTAQEQEWISAFCLPVVQHPYWVEELFAIYAENCFGAQYLPEDLNAPGWYGRGRRRFNEAFVFARFVRTVFGLPPKSVNRSVKHSTTLGF